MPGFLYFVPGRDLPGQVDVDAAGLAYAFESPPDGTGVRLGPSGAAGVTIAQTGSLPTARIRYTPEVQEWRAVVDSPQGVWIGRYKEDRIGPTDLARKEQLAGPEVKLADGNSWIVPVARAVIEEDARPAWYCALPQISTRGKDGRWTVGDVLQRYAPLWQLATNWDDFRQQAILQALDEETADQPATTMQFEFDELHEAAVLAMRMNYRLGADEVDMLGLFTQQHAVDILNATIDLPRRLEIIKKNAHPPDSQTTSGGPGRVD